MGLDINVAALGDWVPGFARVNNRLAGITRAPTTAEISAHRGLLAVNSLRVENLELFVHHIAPGAALRSSDDSDASAEAASTDLRTDLATIVSAARTGAAPPDRLHRVYRMLHPFTYANGRCGRVLWMWQVMRGSRRHLAELARLDLSDAQHPLNSDAFPRSMLM